jgi:hypothetical protein
MKVLLSFCLFVTATLAWAVETPAAAPATSAIVLQGKVLEVKDVGNYSYLRLNTKDGELWAAVMKVPVEKGSTVTIENGSMMSNFESKSLKKTFPTILFGTLGGNTAATAPNGHGGGAASPPLPAAGKQGASTDAPVAKASGTDARTVAEIVTRRAELKDKPVLVRGRVVKYNQGIMGKNWIHLSDGTGSAADKTNDILVTSASETNVGDIVTVQGTVRTDKDFGSGYVYKVLIEAASLQ